MTSTSNLFSNTFTGSTNVSNFLPPPTVPTTLTSANTAPTTSISSTLPPAPTPASTPNAAGAIATNAAATGQYTTPNGAVVDNTGKVITPSPTDTSSAVDPNQAILDYMKSIAPPPSTADMYTKTYGVTSDQARLQKEQAQTDLNTQNKAVTDAQGEFDALNAQINGLDYQSNTVIPNKDQVDATGRGITAAGLAPKTADEQRQILLQKAPLQYQALIAQAKLANAQGKAKLAEGILQQAQGHLDDIFKAQVTDATNQYNYKTNLIDKAYAFADKQQQIKLDAQKATLASQNSQYNAFINDVRTIAASATASGQSSLAAQITKLVSGLDPNSKTFTADFNKVNSQVAELQAKVTPKATIEDKNQSAIQNINSQLTAISNKSSDGYTDPNLYARLRASSTLSGSDFDNRFSYLVNPESRAKLGLSDKTSNVSAEDIKQHVYQQMNDPLWKTSSDSVKRQFIQSLGGNPADFGL